MAEDPSARPARPEDVDAIAAALPETAVAPNRLVRDHLGPA